MVRHKVLACVLFACFTGLCIACGDDGGDDGGEDTTSTGGNDDYGGDGGCESASDCPEVDCPDRSTSRLCVNGGCVTDKSSACL